MAAYTYTITINKFNASGISAALTDSNQNEKNINSALKTGDTILFIVNAINFSGNAIIYKKLITSALSSTGAELGQTSSMFGNVLLNGQPANNSFAPSAPVWVIGTTKTPDSVTLTVNGPPKPVPHAPTLSYTWQFTGTFLVSDDNGCYSYSLPDPEPTVTPG